VQVSKKVLPIIAALGLFYSDEEKSKTSTTQYLAKISHNPTIIKVSILMNVLSQLNGTPTELYFNTSNVHLCVKIIAEHSEFSPNFTVYITTKL
jgi:hypothetical protein